MNKKTKLFLIILLSLSFIVNGILIGEIDKTNMDAKNDLDLVKSEIDKKEKTVSEANNKIEKLNSTVENINNQLSEYTSKCLFYVDKTEEKIMYIIEDTFCVNIQGDKIDILRRGQEVVVTGVISKYEGEATPWYEIKQSNGSQAFVSGKYLADIKPEDIKEQNPVKETGESNNSRGKSQAQIDFEKKTQELIDSGKLGGPGVAGNGEVANFESGATGNDINWK